MNNFLSYLISLVLVVVMMYTGMNLAIYHQGSLEAVGVVTLMLSGMMYVWILERDKR